MTHGILRQHGGDLVIQSLERIGSTVTVELPAEGDREFFPGGRSIDGEFSQGVTEGTPTLGRP